MSWLRYLVPKILLPTFTWPHQVLGSVDLAPSIPPTPRLFPRSVRQAFGFLHNYLRSFSSYYCHWCGIPFDNQIAALPFGLVLKWSDGTRLEEVAATMIARSAGFPVPKIVSYGEHLDAPHAPVSILMTRIPGKDLGDPELYEGMTDDDRESIFAELQCILQVMRKWPHPWGKEQICSVLGTAVRSVRIPGHAVGPFESESEFNDHLFSSISGHSFETREKFEETVGVAERLRKMRHPIVFTHGDLKHHNIMVLDGHISGFLDWESAGWYPDYWEFTTPLRFGPRDFWWNELVWRLGGDKYAAELESEKALVPLTVDAWAW
ncbi:kinase-like protein [Trematosphaeria pertusa]|uniref:Kinase-like protein n=1 Tax=Trematosphaeria pertusa TaxID=390896 RepID=A0A6A6I653_9PLEO|nr:kinase-like protein [Trematosphaeria pertusa]KAF2245033.1 kinase-like protein [Trematosphaeria pertusa]